MERTAVGYLEFSLRLQRDAGGPFIPKTVLSGVQSASLHFSSLTYLPWFSRLKNGSYLRGYLCGLNEMEETLLSMP